MSKKNDQKRKAALSMKSQIESFRFNVEWKRKKLDIVPADHTTLNAEMDAITEFGLVDAFNALKDLVNGVREELGAEPEADRGTLNGTVVPFILGITSVNPMTAEAENRLLTTLKATDMPLQVTMVYDNEIRNQVVDWVKAHYESTSTRLGIPILKLKNMVVTFQRVVKN